MIVLGLKDRHPRSLRREAIVAKLVLSLAWLSFPLVTIWSLPLRRLFESLSLKAKIIIIMIVIII